jgi:hypothetical protein
MEKFIENTEQNYARAILLVQVLEAYIKLMRLLIGNIQHGYINYLTYQYPLFLEYFVEGFWDSLQA